MQSICQQVHSVASDCSLEIHLQNMLFLCFGDCRSAKNITKSNECRGNSFSELFDKVASTWLQSPLELELCIKNNTGFSGFTLNRYISFSSVKLLIKQSV